MPDDISNKTNDEVEARLRAQDTRREEERKARSALAISEATDLVTKTLNNLRASTKITDPLALAILTFGVVIAADRGR